MKLASNTEPKKYLRLSARLTEDPDNPRIDSKACRSARARLTFTRVGH